MSRAPQTERHTQLPSHILTKVLGAIMEHAEIKIARGSLHNRLMGVSNPRPLLYESNALPLS